MMYFKISVQAKPNTHLTNSFKLNLNLHNTTFIIWEGQPF